MNDFLTDYFETALRPAEVLARIARANALTAHAREAVAGVPGRG